MSRCLLPLLAVGSLSSAACIPAPSFELTSSGGDGGWFDTEEAPWEPPDPGEDENPMSTTGSPDGGPTPESSSSASTSTTGADRSESGAGLTGTAGDESSSGGEASAFPPPEPFGDEPAEGLLVGTWSAVTDVGSLTVSVASDGGFEWLEHDPECGLLGSASGQLWVEGAALIFHVDVWDKPDPWPLEVVLGQPLLRPFRVRVPTAIAPGRWTFSAPSTVSEVFAWEGRALSREASPWGPFGVWAGTAELWAVEADGARPRRVVVDRYQIETGAAAVSTMSHQRTWDSGLEEAPVEASGIWFNLTPGEPTGSVSIDGETYSYSEAFLASESARGALRPGGSGC